MKAYLFFDSARPEGPSYDLLTGSDETQRGMCEEVEIPVEQFADWKFVLGHYKETHSEFARVQREMQIALRLPRAVEPSTPSANAKSDDPADWWKD